MTLAGYRVELSYWVRSSDGDDWVGGEHSQYFSTLEEAIAKASNPFKDDKGMIESKVYDLSEMHSNKYGKLVWHKDWFDNKVLTYY